jgi:hypothetical protein
MLFRAVVAPASPALAATLRRAIEAGGLGAGCVREDKKFFRSDYTPRFPDDMAKYRSHSPLNERNGQVQKTIGVL